MFRRLSLSIRSILCKIVRIFGTTKFSDPIRRFRLPNLNACQKFAAGFFHDGILLTPVTDGLCCNYIVMASVLHRLNTTLLDHVSKPTNSLTGKHEIYAADIPTASNLVPVSLTR